MQWEIISKTDAAQETAVWQSKDIVAFNTMVTEWPDNISKSLGDDYLKLRNEVIEVYRQVRTGLENDSSLKKRKDYLTDLIFGVQFYQILKKYGFNVRTASNDQVWFYLGVKVFPDIVYDRYPGSKVKTDSGTEFRNVNEDRYWKTRRRIYLKVIWWYIYLSLQTDEQGNEDLKKTRFILKDNSTDEIVQIVERSGTAGYRVEVYRELMNFYSLHRDIYDNKRFRQVMVLNTARTQIVEPALMEGGIQAYVKELFEYFDKQ